MKKIIGILVIALIGFAVVSCVEDDVFPAPPLVSSVSMNPMAPESNQDITITATVTDINGVESVKLYYKINEGSYITQAMARVGTTNNYTGTIPGQESLTNVHYYIEATNVINKTAVSPASAPATPTTITIGGAVVFHYWHFNGLPARIDAPETVPSDFTFTGLAAANIRYEGAYLDAINPGTVINAQMGAEEGLGLRIRSAYGDLIITAPSTGFKDLEMSFALSRSGSGADTAEVLYSVDGGTTWVTIQTVSGFEGEPVWTGYNFDLKSITAINNSANLLFKIIPSNSTSGNLRMDNLAILGVKM